MTFNIARENFDFIDTTTTLNDAGIHLDMIEKYYDSEKHWVGGVFDMYKDNKKIGTIAINDDEHTIKIIALDGNAFCE